MGWLSQLASNYAKQANTLTTAQVFDKRMSWQTPDGFEVVHFVEEMKAFQMDTALDGRIQLRLEEGNGRLKVSGMSLAVAPNFVHALDATHLRITIRQAQAMGIADFGMVHDSFGVHAAHMGKFLSRAVKPAFVEMYTEHDPLLDLYNRYATVAPSLPPAKGTLDITQVQQSEFFFS
jgi:DNA-directed RNA polymerase